MLINKSQNPYPQHQTSLSAAFDIAAAEAVTLAPGETKLISTGLFLDGDAEVIRQERMAPPKPDGKVRVIPALFILPRSGMALKGLQVGNAPGLVDLDYQQEIKVIAYNASQNDIQIETGTRIAQGVFIDTVQFLPVKPAERVGGFGSTN